MVEHIILHSKLLRPIFNQFEYIATVRNSQCEYWIQIREFVFQVIGNIRNDVQRLVRVFQ